MIIILLRQTIVFTNFQITRAIISEKSCENIAPKSNCHGSFQLVRAVKKKGPQQEKSPSTPNKKNWK